MKNNEITTRESTSHFYQCLWMVLLNIMNIKLDSGLFKSYQFSVLRIKLFRERVPLAYCCTTEQLTRPFMGPEAA